MLLNSFSGKERKKHVVKKRVVVKDERGKVSEKKAGKLRRHIRYASLAFPSSSSLRIAKMKGEPRTNKQKKGRKRFREPRI